MIVWEQDQEETHFLNVDVAVWSRSKLEPLVAAFGRRIGVHYVGPEGKGNGAHFSLAKSFEKDANTVARQLATLVTKLPRPARRLWDGARQRDFNIGIQAGIKPHSPEYALEPETVRLVARVGGRIVVTIYAAERPRARPAKATREEPALHGRCMTTDRSV
jgi:hypothetical protein